MCEAELKGYKGWSRSGAVFSSDGKLIISASSDKTAIIWDAVTYEFETELNRPYMSENAQLSDNGVFFRNKNNKFICLSSQLSFLDTYEDTIFHTKNFQKISIPNSFRTPLCISHHLSKICFGYKSGGILVSEVSIFKPYFTLINFCLKYSFWINIENFI